MKKIWVFELQKWVLFLVCRLLMMTWRIRFVGVENRRLAVSKNKLGSFIIATLHENAIGGVLSHPGQGIYCLASRSKDGEFVAFICEKIGLGAVRGSSSRGGREARDEMIDLLLKGTSCAITVDGPRGPRGVPKAGVIDIARKSGAAILITTAVADRMWVLRKTWDQTKIPKPFSRLLIHYREPFFIDSDLERKDYEPTIAKIQSDLKSHDEETLKNFEILWN